MTYPNTRHQEATARRFGWYKNRDGSWEEPENLSKGDFERIKAAQAKRERKAERGL